MNTKIATGIVLIVGKNNCYGVQAIKEISQTKVELYYFDGHVETLEDYGDFAT